VLGADASVKPSVISVAAPTAGAIAVNVNCRT
jgi:hypothetical protein